MNTSIILKQFGLVQGDVNYSDKANAFLSTGYTSAAGNTYFNAVRFAEGIIIKEDVGQGYAHTFLNGIRIFSTKNQQIIAERDFHSHIYSKNTVECNSITMLMEVLIEAAESEDVELDEDKARAQVTKVIRRAMQTDQRELVEQQSRKYLN
ncbi:MAG: hypothetical protein DRI86_08665 [Bacteroidetes bacterium]|nr:MAG: hypothetical protein DRI86_08665 [Bacteroidota bacterium]